MLLVPILFGLLIACGLFIKLEQNWQAGILVGAILWGVAIVFIAEGLGILGQFSRNFVLCAWIILDIVLAIIWLYRINKTKNLFNFSQLRLPSELGLISRLLLGLIFFIALLTSITALVAPPNNWDSMTYHMSRVMHWLHNSRLDHYPTHYTPQLYHPPWAEMAIAHLQVLTGGDHWANFVQWLSMIGSIIGVSAIARELGASRRGQLFATVFAISLPMGLLQSVTTQNDYAVCFWLVCLAYFVLRINHNKLTLPLTLKVSASLGLALLTKTSAYIFSLPFLAWLAVRVIYQMGWQSWQTGFILIISVLLINAGHWFRNWEVFGSPITGGPKELAVQYRMEDPNIATLLSNMVRNAAIHLSTPSRWLNAKLNGAIISFHKLIGIASNSPQTTIPGGKFGIFQVSFKEDLAGNTFHFLTILATIGAFFTISRLRRIRTAWL
ncbi:MAG: 4-amino-4-deoxy-L-arabinose transferase, partial [Cyanobacteria bacterium J083]